MLNYEAVYYESPIGLIEIAGTEAGITSIDFVDEKRHSSDHGLECLEQGRQQIDEYFRGERREFSLKLDLKGTAFQKTVWQQLRTIPYDETVSYRDIAGSLGKKSAMRAVGNANGRNPVAIAVPCHRVIGANGKLVGYAGGVWRKEWLLEHEKKNAVS